MRMMAAEEAAWRMVNEEEVLVMDFEYALLRIAFEETEWRMTDEETLRRITDK
jgi:hypothetical protein